MSPTRQKPIPSGSGAVGEFAQALRDARDAAGIATDSELAARVIYSKSTISKALSGTKLPTPTIVQALATAFGDDPAVWLQRLEQARAAHEAAATATPDTGVDDDAAKKSRWQRAVDNDPRLKPFVFVMGPLMVLLSLLLLANELATDTGPVEWFSGTPASNQEKPRDFSQEHKHESWIWQHIGPHATVNTTFTTVEGAAAMGSLGGQLSLSRDCKATIAWTIKADGVIVATGTLDSTAAARFHVRLQGYTETLNFTAKRQDRSVCITSLTWVDDLRGRN